MNEAVTITDGRYRKLGPLGRGAMGDVFLARDEVLERLVAVKVAREADGSGKDRIAGLRREARLLARVSHSNVVKVYSSGRTDWGSPCIVMEYVDGETLRDRLEGSSLDDLDLFCSVMSQVCAAVAELHREGVVHRDLKPANVMLSANGEVGLRAKLIDFGLAEQLDDEGRTTGDAAASTCSGTPAYMSPEQARGGAADKRSDIYSLAVMACELLSGKLPFQATSGRRMLVAHLVEPPSLPSALCPQRGLLPGGEVDRVLARALAKDVEDRYQTVEAFANDLIGAVSRWSDAGASEPVDGAAAPAVRATVDEQNLVTVKMARRLAA